MIIITCATFGFLAVAGAVATSHTNNTTTQEVEQSITPTLDLVETEELSGDRAVLVIRSDVPQTVTITDARSDVLVSEVYTVSEGRTRITYNPDNGQVGRLYLGAGQRAEFIGRGSGQLVNLNQLSGQQVPYAAVGGGGGSITAVVLFVWWKRRKLLNGFIEYVTDDYIETPPEWKLNDDEEEPEGRISKVWYSIKRELRSTRTKLAVVLVAGVAVQQYYGITPSDIPIWVWVVVASAGLLIPLTLLVWPRINERFDLLRVQSDLVADIGGYEAYYNDDVTPAQIDDDALNEIVSITDLPVLLYETHPSVMTDVDVEGQVRTFDIPFGTLHLVRAFDPQNMKAEAATLSEIPEHKLMSFASAVVEARERANLFVRFGKRAYRSFTTIAERVETAHHLRLGEKERELKTYGDDVEEQLKGAFPELEALEDDGNPVSDEYAKLMGTDDVDEQNDESPSEGGDTDE